MSYTVRITGKSPSPDQVNDEIAVTTFSGGSARGHMIQLTINPAYLQITPAESKQLRKVLKYAERHSLVDWPGND